MLLDPATNTKKCSIWPLTPRITAWVKEQKERENHVR
jgi:hypothetical protein